MLLNAKKIVSAILCLNKIMNIFEVIINFILRFIVSPISWICSLLFKFFSDILKNLYGRVVAIVAACILAYLIFGFLR